MGQKCRVLQGQGFARMPDLILFCGAVTIAGDVTLTQRFKDKHKMLSLYAKLVSNNVNLVYVS